MPIDDISGETKCPEEPFAKPEAKSKKSGGLIELIISKVNTTLQPLIASSGVLFSPVSSLFSPASKELPSNFLQTCQTGDIILECSSAPRAAMVRLLTHDKISHVVMILRHPALIDGQPFVVGSGGLARKYKFTHMIRSPEIKDAVYCEKYHVGPYCVPLAEYLAYYEKNEHTKALVRCLITSDENRLKISQTLREIVERSWERASTFEECARRFLFQAKHDDSATCSESVGMFMSHMGITTIDRAELWNLYPGSFMEGEKMDSFMADGYSYSKEKYLRLRSQLNEDTFATPMAMLSDHE